MNRALTPQTLRRSQFLLGAAGLVSALGAAPPIRVPADPTDRIGATLVLGGGGARGAYEAGVIEGMRRSANARDGERIAGIEVACGTSIGAINAWFVATGQYSALASLWHGIASEQIFAIKARYAKIGRPSAGLFNRIAQTLAIARGVTSTEQGVLDADPIAQWIARHVDPHTPLVAPFVFTATNLDRARAEVFYRLPFKVSDAARDLALGRLRMSVGRTTVVREVSDGLLLAGLRASAAIPVLFDPVIMTAPEGSRDRYVDGGVADNTPIDVGRALSTSVYAVMVDPSVPSREAYANAVSIGVGAFGIAQQRILEASLRATYLETREKRLSFARATGEEREFLASVLDTDLFTIRPKAELPVEVVEFDQQAKIDAAYAVGLADVADGWTSHAYSVDGP